MVKFKVVFFLLLFSSGSLLSKNKLVSGPMQGYTTPNSIKVWLMVKHADFVVMTLTNEKTGEKQIQKKMLQDAVSVKKHVPIVFDFTNLQENTNYQYQLNIGTKTILGNRVLKTTSSDKNQSFSFLIGSCAITIPSLFKPFHPGNEERIYPAMTRTPSDFMLWLGDYLYYTFFQMNNFESMMLKNINKRKNNKINTFLKSRPQYAIWDDHDYGPNDGNKDYILKKEALEVWKLFWANPFYGTPEIDGTFYNFKHLDAEFFMTDNRYHRTLPEDTLPTMLGNEQFNWLLTQLKASTATFKFVAVGSQIINKMNKGECWLHYKTEIDSLFSFIEENAIEGIIFLSGDRHFTELLKMERENSYPFYEFTSSPISSMNQRSKNITELENPAIVEGTLYLPQNYGRITISGPISNRKCTLETFDNKGNLVWSYTINQSELE